MFCDAGVNGNHFPRVSGEAARGPLVAGVYFDVASLCPRSATALVWNRFVNALFNQEFEQSYLTVPVSVPGGIGFLHPIPHGLPQHVDVRRLENTRIGGPPKTPASQVSGHRWANP